MKKLALALSVTALVGAAACLVPADAAAGTSITVPAKGPTQVATTWTGTVPLGVDPEGLSCTQGSLLTPEKHTFTVSVAKGAYGVVNAVMSVTVASQPFLNGDFMELLDPSGHSVGTDQQKPQMEVDVANPVAGKWTAVVCQFLPDDASNGHAYDGQVTITTKCKGKSPCPAPPKKKAKR